MQILSVKKAFKGLLTNNLGKSGNKKTKVSIGKILDQTFSLFFKQIGLIFLMGLICASIPYYFSIYQFTKTPILYYSIKGVAWLFHILFSGVAILICRDWHNGEKISWKRAFFQTFRQYHKVLAAWILIILAIIGGTICFIIPGIIVALSLACFLPVMLIENCSLQKSWNRSFALVKGCRFRILMLYFACYIIQLIIAAVPTFCVSFLPWETQFQLGVIISGLTGLLLALTWTFCHFSSTFLYYQLREKKEGLDLEELSIEIETKAA